MARISAQKRAGTLDSAALLGLARPLARGPLLSWPLRTLPRAGHGTSRSRAVGRGPRRRIGRFGDRRGRTVTARRARARVADRALPGLRGEGLALGTDLDAVLLVLRRVVTVDVHLLQQGPGVAGEPVEQHAEGEDEPREQHRDRDE